VRYFPVTRINTVALCGLRTLPGLRRHCPSQLRFGARCSKVREALSREMFRRRRVGWICARVILLANSAGRRWAEWRRQQPPVVEAELHLLLVDDLLQPPVAPQRAALAVGWRGERAGLRRRVPEASASSDGLPTPAVSAVPFPSSLSAAAQAHPAWSLSRGSEERPCVPRR
jgi:hypothetical protein